MQEIERKFLVAEWPNNIEGKSYAIEQFYILFKPEVRLRKVTPVQGKNFETGDTPNTKYFITAKGEGNQIREEIESEISAANYQANMKNRIGRLIRKVRTKLPLENGLTAEVDEYVDMDLTVVEVEFSDEKQAEEFQPPVWFGKEVTDDPRYKNKNLARNLKIDNIIEE